MRYNGTNVNHSYLLIIGNAEQLKISTIKQLKFPLVLKPLIIHAW